MKRSLLAIVIAVSMMTGSSAFAADIDSMTLEELKAAYTELESEKAQLESENADLKDQIEQLKTTEEETERNPRARSAKLRVAEKRETEA